MTDPLDPSIDAQSLEPAPGRWRRWYAVVAAGALVLTLAFVVRGCTQRTLGPGYLTTAVTKGELSVLVSATGNLAPTTQVDVGSEISGTVERVLVEANDRVAEGQLLAIIDSSRLSDSVARSEATLLANQATADRERATALESETQLQRLLEVSRLSDAQIPSRQELESQRAVVARAKAAVRVADANIRVAQAQLSSDRTQVAKARIRSPVSGVVLKRSVNPGQTVQAAFNTPSLFIIARDLRQLKLEVSIDEANVGQVDAGQKAMFSVDAFPGRQFPATIERVDLGARNLTSTSTAASSGSNVVAYLASLSLDNEAQLLRPGMTATVSIATAGETDVLLVPNAALRFEPEQDKGQGSKGGFQLRPPDARGTPLVREREIGPGSEQAIHVLDANESLRRVAVVTGKSDGRMTAVRGDDLREGMRVVTGIRARSSP